MANVFKFKQFDVDQAGCAMKINTDGVLLGALTQADNAIRILDIGTGTGVMALMLAQKFPDAVIDAVEIDTVAAETAGRNFENSTFSNRLKIYLTGFELYFEIYSDKQYDLIVSNPPFYINSLKASVSNINLAKHADNDFFDGLIKAVSTHLTADGSCWLILPIQTSVLVKALALQHGLNLQKTINIYSFADVDAHREIIVLGRNKTKSETESFVIYDSPKVYTKQYQDSLMDFFTIF